MREEIMAKMFIDMDYFDKKISEMDKKARSIFHQELLDTVQRAKKMYIHGFISKITYKRINKILEFSPAWNRNLISTKDFMEKMGIKPLSPDYLLRAMYRLRDAEEQFNQGIKPKFKREKTTKLPNVGLVEDNLKSVSPENVRKNKSGVRQR